MPISDEDDPETQPCYRHSNVQTALSCSACDKPICTDCAIQAAVGIKCPDCARQTRAALGHVPISKIVVGVVAGGVIALVGGFLLAFLSIPYIGLILAFGLGHLVGAATRKASGGYRDPLLTKASAISAFIGVILVPVIRLIQSGGNASAMWVFFAVLAAVFASIGARNSAGR